MHLSQVGGIHHKMIRYNNYTGFSTVAGYNILVANLVDVGYNIEDGYGKFSASFSPMRFLQTLVTKELRAYCVAIANQGSAETDKEKKKDGCSCSSSLH